MSQLKALRRTIEGGPIAAGPVAAGPVAAGPVAAGPGESVLLGGSPIDGRPVESSRTLAGRRSLLLLLIGAITALLVWLGAGACGLANGWTPVNGLLFACFVANAPWLALSAATALIGAGVRLFSPDPAAAVLPVLRSLDDAAPIGLGTLLALCVRNEPVERVAATAALLLRQVEDADLAGRFTVAVLSDTDDPEVAAAETAAFGNRSGVLYRRRALNEGFKAGNVMSFLDEAGERFELFVCLDADSRMEFATILRLVRVMQADAGLAILQPLFSGSGSETLFARLFRFGHRQGGRIWATGQAWWQGDRGPYWGHNAILRVAPFRAHCRLPRLRNGQLILSHDHVEAARLHGAGWAVRVLADDRGSFEDHPPTIPDLLARDLRWAAGNLQYRHLLFDRSLGRLGRLQMLQALLHYALTPFWLAMLPLALIVGATGAPGSRAAVVAAVACGYGCLHLPKLLGLLDVLVAPGADKRALLRLAAAELCLTLLLDPLVAFDKCGVLLTLARGRGGSWSAQDRSDRRIGWRMAAGRFWPATLAGVLLLVLASFGSWFTFLLAMVCTAGLVLSVPLAVISSHTRNTQRYRSDLASQAMPS